MDKFAEHQRLTEDRDFDLKYMTIGLCGEVGEVCNEIKKMERDDGNVMNEKRLKKILSVPFSRKIELVIALGYPASDTEYRERPLKDRREVVSFNEY